ncbi:UNVERIFIED_CONTAM: hypothetical protein Sindi_2853600 [Sesamum indicum]
MVNVNAKLPKHLIIMLPMEEGGEHACKVDGEYEWFPPKCTTYMSLRHATKDCATTKAPKPPVNVYVQRVRHSAPIAPPTVEKDKDEAHQSVGRDIPTTRREQMDRDKVWNVRGLNKRDHQLALKDLVAKFRLHFLGLLETRVQMNNASRIQSLLLPYWKWFVDSVTVATHVNVIVTVIYGANDITACRELWRSFGDARDDFNAIRDLSEICGTSSDIRVVMKEFNACIQDTGLLPLPMQSEWFTWHNRSSSSRSLWKRLDSMLISDAWLERLPTSYYYSLTPHISVYSSLVLYRDRQQQLGGMFRFDNYLTLSPNFIPSVKNVWQHEVVGVPMYVITHKLKALKPVFRHMRINKGDLTMNVQLAKGFLETAQQLVSTDRRNELFLLQHCCRLVYAKAVKLEQIMLQQRAKMQWMKGGINVHESSFTRLRNAAEVKQAVFDIVEDKAPGPNGSSSGFYKAAWPIVGPQITKAILDSLLRGRCLSKSTPRCWHLYPSIGDNIMLAQELFTGYNQVHLPPRCPLKVDIWKAYDTVEWDFLLAVLYMFGFPA